MLAQGIIHGLGVKEWASSPTFTLVNEYAGRLCDGRATPVRIYQSTTATSTASANPRNSRRSPSRKCSTAKASHSSNGPRWPRAGSPGTRYASASAGPVPTSRRSRSSEIERPRPPDRRRSAPQVPAYLALGRRAATRCRSCWIFVSDAGPVMTARTTLSGEITTTTGCVADAPIQRCVTAPVESIRTWTLPPRSPGGPPPGGGPSSLPCGRPPGGPCRPSPPRGPAPSRGRPTV